MDENTVTSMIEDLEAAARAMQQSLLKRNVDHIWRAIDSQEQAAARLSDYMRTHSEVFRGVAQNSPAIRRMLERSQSLMRTNRAMASRFLDLMDKTLSQLGGGSRTSGRGYGAAPRRAAPMLVRQMG